MEAKLKDAQWLGSILKHMSSAVIATDKVGLVTFMNPVAESLTGRNEEAVIGTPLREVFTLLDRETRAALKIPAARSFQQNNEHVHFRHSILVSDNGEEAPVDVTVSPIKGDEGTVNGCVLIFHDISERLTKDQRMLDRQKIQAIGNMASYIAHDFNNWLWVISGHASSIADNLIPKTRAHEEALKILEMAEHAGALTKHLLSVARASNIQGDMKIEPVSLSKVIGDATSMLEGTFAQQQISFRVRNPDAMPYVEADAGQLLDCLINLFLNAANAMPDGGTITIDAAEKTEGKRNFAVLRVRDTGAGMTKDVADRIFEPFFSTEEPGSAIGLGLTVVQSSVQRWGGYVKVRSQPGHGTSFRLFIPKAKTRAARDARRGVHAGGETILLVDDKKDLLAEARDILRDAGYKVHSASSGEECLSIYGKHPNEINLSIIDVVMPGKDGKKVLENILELDPTAAIIMTSGFSRDYVRGYLERGAWGFVQKPFDRDHLLGIVRRMLDQKSAHKTKDTDSAKL